jgi:hypothetical protein
MNLFAISSIFIIISASTMAFLVLWKAKDRKLALIWSSLCVATLIWGIGGYRFSIETDPAKALFWWKFAYIGPILIPGLFFHFISRYLALNKKWLIIATHMAALLFIYFDWNFPQVFLGNVQLVFNQFFWVHHGKKNFVFLIFYIYTYWILIIAAFVLLSRELKKTTGSKRIQLKCFIFASAVGWLGAEGDFMIDFGFYVYPYSNFLIGIYPLIMTYAMIRHQFLDISVVIKKGLVYSVLVTVVTGGYLIFVLVIGRVFQGLVGYQSFVINLMAVFAIAVLFNPLRDWIQRVLDKRFFQGTLESLSQERQRLQQELFHAEKLAYVGQLASSIAHEIRNPLTAIKTYIEYFPKKHLDPAIPNAHPSRDRAHRAGRAPIA